MSSFAQAFAAEYKGFMSANGITNLQIAKKLGRNDGYVSERASGKRPLDTEDVDALAMLVDGWTGKDLMLELARRTRETTKLAAVTPIHRSSDVPTLNEDDLRGVARTADPEPDEEH